MYLKETSVQSRCTHLQSCSKRVSYIRKEKAKNDGFEFKSGKIRLKLNLRLSAVCF